MQRIRETITTQILVPMLLADNDTYLLFANRPYINRINVNGEFFHIVGHHEDQIILGIDYDYR